MGVYQIEANGHTYEVQANSDEEAAAMQASLSQKTDIRAKDVANTLLRDVPDVALASIYGIGQTAHSLSSRYLGGTPDAEYKTPSLLGYDLHSEGAKEIAKTLGYLPEKVREFVVGATGREGAGDAMDAAGLILLGKGGYRGAKTPKAIGTHEHLGAVRVLADAGVPLTLAERKPTATTAVVGVASDTINAIKDSGFKEKQIAKFTEATLKNAGINGKVAVPEVMGPRLRQLQSEFNNYDATVHTAMDKPFAKELMQLLEEAKLAPENVQSFVQRNVDNLQIQAAQNGGVIPGEALHMARTSLDRHTSDPTVGSFASDLRNIMDSALERQAPPDVAAAIRVTRAGYRDMKAIEKAVKGNPSGQIMPDKLFAVYSDSKRSKGTIYGEGETANHVLARAGAKVLGANPISKGQALAAIPMSGIGIAAVAAANPPVAAGIGAGLVSSRFVNENQAIARTLGGRGRIKTSRLPTKSEALGAYYSATTPEARKQALEELTRAHAPE